MADARLTAALALAAAQSCAVPARPPGGGPAAVRASPSAGDVSGRASGFSDVDPRRIVDARASVALTLPQGASWVVSHQSGWAVAEHRGTRTTLRARAWRAERLVNRHGCETEARHDGTMLPALDPGDVLAERGVPKPRGFDTWLRLALYDDRAGGSRGVLLAVGANVRRCVALVVETRSVGRGAVLATIERLGFIEHHVLPSLVVRDVAARLSAAHGARESGH